MDDERTLQYFLQGLVWYSAIKHAAKTLFQVKFSLLSFTLPLTYNFSMIKKSYKCEDGTQLKISVWHLLMNLKNKYLSKENC